MVLQGMGILFVLFVVLVVAFAGYLLILHNQPLVLPAPTGSHHVGRIEYDWVDDHRIDPLSDTANEKRELLVWVWYPASESVPGSTAPFLPAAWVKAHERDQGIGRFIEADFSSIQTHSFADAPIAESQSAYPVIIMQPGMGPVPTDYTVFAEDLASHGYIVVGINETHTSNLIVFPDGSVVLRTEEGTIPDSADPATADADASRIGMVWTDDAIFVMDRLRSINVDESDFFHNKLDLAHIGLFGHSFGGATAASVCETDARCKAGADLDGTLFSYQSRERLHTPFMFMAEDGCGKNCDTMYQAYSTSDSAAYYLSITGAKHFNFSDLPLRLLPPARIPFRLVGYIGSISPERGSEISRAYLVAFFDRYLKNVRSDLLRASSPAYPEVEFEGR
jgi:predicted dienelactone hydrolase